MDGNFLKKLIIIFFGCIIVSCSDSSDPLTSQAASEAGYTFSGTILQGSAHTHAQLKTDFTTQLTNMLIVAQNLETKKVSMSEVSSDGAFSMNVNVPDQVTNDDTFIVSLLQKEPLKLIGIVGQAADSSAVNKVTGLRMSESLTDLQIQYNEAQAVGNMSASQSTLTFHADIKTRLVNGKPAGFDSKGKGSASKNASPSAINKLDPDEDGLVNIFDPMDDGANIDNTNLSTRVELVAGSSVATHASMFMNNKVDYDKIATTTITNNALITIEVLVNNPSLVVSMEADLVHSNYSAATTTLLPVGFTAIDSFPAGGTLWSSTGYKLYHVQNFDGQDIWTVFIKPNNNLFDVGDMIRIKATLTDGTIEYYWVSIHFKFQTEDIFTDETTWIHGGAGSVASPFCILDTGGRVFYWNAPTDESGANLMNLNYQFELFFLENSAPESVVHTGVPEVIDIGYDTYNSQIPEATINKYRDGTTALPNILQVDVKASYPYGDNMALKIYMARNSWGTTASCPD